MIPIRLIKTKKTIYKLYNEVGFINQFDCNDNIPTIDEVNALITWIETELYEQVTRVKEADIGFLFQDILRGMVLISSEIKTDKHVYNDITLYCYLEAIMLGHTGCQTSPNHQPYNKKAKRFFRGVIY